MSPVYSLAEIFVYSLYNLVVWLMMIYPAGTDERVDVDNAFAFVDLTLYIILVAETHFC